MPHQEAARRLFSAVPALDENKSPSYTYVSECVCMCVNFCVAKMFLKEAQMKKCDSIGTTL